MRARPMLRLAKHGQLSGWYFEIEAQADFLRRGVSVPGEFPPINRSL